MQVQLVCVSHMYDYYDAPPAVRLVLYSGGYGSTVGKLQPEQCKNPEIIWPALLAILRQKEWLLVDFHHFK